LSRSAARVCTALRCLVPRLSQSPTARALQHTPAPRGVLSGAWGLRGPPAPNVQRS
jgi:hypothetical protein